MLSLSLIGQAEPLVGAVDGSLVRAVVGTFAVLGLVALLAYLVRRGVLVLPGQRAPRSMAVETALPLGERRSLAIVRVEDRRLLLGLTPSQINVLAELGAAPAGFEQALDRAAAPQGTPS